MTCKKTQTGCIRAIGLALGTSMLMTACDSGRQSTPIHIDGSPAGTPEQSIQMPALPSLAMGSGQARNAMGSASEPSQAQVPIFSSVQHLAITDLEMTCAFPGIGLQHMKFETQIADVMGKKQPIQVVRLTSAGRSESQLVRVAQFSNLNGYGFLFQDRSVWSFETMLSPDNQHMSRMKWANELRMPDQTISCYLINFGRYIPTDGRWSDLRHIVGNWNCNGAPVSFAMEGGFSGFQRQGAWVFEAAPTGIASEGQGRMHLLSPVSADGVASDVSVVDVDLSAAARGSIVLGGVACSKSS